MLKRNKRKIFIYTSLAVLFILLVIGYLSGFFFLSGITPCLPPPGVMVDGAAVSTVYTWIDANGNGVIDTGENPLPNVEIKYPYSGDNNSITNNNGTARTYVFKAGCVCKCWYGEFVEITIPNGFRPTTPVRVDLKSAETHAIFGFIPVNP